MNVNDAIKNIKKELKTICQENETFRNLDVTNYINKTKNEIRQIEKERDFMLDLVSNGYDYRNSMITSVNFCYECMADCNFMFSQKCKNMFYNGYEEYITAKNHYEEEENRLRSTKI